MTAVLLRAREELRARWRSSVSLTVMLAVFGGAVMAVAAGARRTDSAYPRFLLWKPSMRRATLLLADISAYLPGRAAGRVQPATVLRTE